ncbi:MAG: 4-alpha-glucanotransferase [Bryobacterales bacterium]|nr:4-alpha-glucanotransferase [Bryobacterales bacterium]
MRPEHEHEILARAAALWGIAPEYYDIWGNRHETSDETYRAILRALGLPADPDRLAEAVLARESSAWTRVVAPTLVQDAETERHRFPVQIRASEATPAWIELRHENGTLDRYRADLSALPTVAAQEVDGALYLRKDAPLPDGLGLGYYDLSVTVDGSAPCTSRLILAPGRCWLPEDLRTAGLAISLYGVRSARNWGCGDFRDLRGIADWVAADAGASFIALNPLHAIHNRRPFNTSPYLPNSVFYRNAIYLDVEAIEDFQNSPRAQRLWNQPGTRQALAALRDSEFVEYEQVWAWKLRFLKLAFLWFLRERRSGSDRWRAFEEYCAREGALLDRFATYCALDESIHRRNPDIWIWPDWPTPYQDPASPETDAFRRRRWRSVLFYKYAQWHLERQVSAAQAYARERGLAIGLYHDLALATDTCGSDLWAHRDHFVAGCRVGSPPDDFAPQGQDWGFPPPRSDRHYETGYRLFAESIRHASAHGGALRIDHVMRFSRLYWIPDGNDATAGAYVRERFEDVLRVLALESVRNRFLVVGEDLGTVEPHVRDTLERFGVLSYRLFYFERDRDGSFIPAGRYPASALVSSTTHDLPTLAGFWSAEDIRARRDAGTIQDDASFERQLESRAKDKQHMLDALHAGNLLPEWHSRDARALPELTGEIHNAVIGFLASTPSRLLLINQEDLTKESRQQNLPGTTWQYPNWSRKMKYTVEELTTAHAARDFTEMFCNWLDRTGRR